MPILTKANIIGRITRRDLVFEPQLDQFQLQTHSVDLRLGFSFMLPKVWEMEKVGRVAINIDPLSGFDKKYYQTIELKPGQYFEVLPKEFVIVSTLETLKIPPDIMGVLYPRSSVNRRGLSVDLTGIVDAGYKGKLIIPIRNNTESQVIRVYPGERFCQIVFYTLNGETQVRTSRYDGVNKSQVGVVREESEIEMKLIREGKVDSLKRSYKI